MNRYRKAWVAVLGGLVQVLAVADSASSAGVLPDSWVPWVTAAVAVATAAGVYKVENAPLRGGLTPGEAPAREFLRRETDRPW